ncbi:MAG: DUF4019 domain-containing protein [Candidatus Omnitrophica bacterium]|nr:DUF4019 domain-containing protein [Candidatus Omnitrophota bacterium]
MKKVLIGLGITFLVIIVLFAVFGGFAFLNANKLTPSIEKFITDFYGQYRQKNFSYIYSSMADEKFRSTGSLADFEKLMNGIHQRLGFVKERKKGAWRINYAPDGTYFSIQYVVTYEKGDATDSFVLKKHGDSWLLISYNVNSRALF